MAFEDILKGAGTGATLGGTIGTAFGPGPGTAIGTAAGGAIGAIGSAILGRAKPKETPMQEKQRELVDQMLASLRGEGPFSNLFNVDEASFQKSFVDPMKQKFQSQIAPQIQQSFIASGQQRGTGLDDTLTRAGVDMDQLLNQFYFQQQQEAMNRQASAMGGILGQGPGVGPGQTAGEAALSGLGGFLGSPGFGEDIQGIVRSLTNRPQGEIQQQSIQDTFLPPRKGFEREQQVYNPYTGVQR